jgi:putative ABC transport system permease protein
MARPRIQKIFSDLGGNRLRSALVLASIAVGLFAIGVVGTIYVAAPQDMQKGYEATNPANIYVQTSLFDRGLVEHIQGVDGVRQAEGARIFGSRIEVSPGEWIGIDLKAQKYTSGNQINQMHLVEGVWPPGDREIVIDRYKLDDTHASLGDYLTVELPSGNTRLLKVVGVVQDQTIGAYRGAGGFFSAPVQGYINQDTVEWLEQPLPKRFNILFVTIVGDSKDRQHLESIWQNVRREIEQYDVDIISSTQRSSYEHPNLYLSTAILNVLVVIGLLVSFLSGFLITNTLQAIMNQQVTQIGILKTVGARRGQISTIYLLLSLLFGVIAFLIAAPPSALLAFRIIDFLNIQMNYTFLGPRLIPEVVIIQALIAMLMPLAAALFPVWQGTRISVQEALSGLRQDHPPDQGWLDRRLSGLRKVSLLLVVGLRNTIRRKGRLALTLVTLTLGGAVFIATFNVRVSMMDYIQQITQYFQADVNITLDRVYFTDEIAKAIVEVPG